MYQKSGEYNFMGSFRDYGDAGKIVSAAKKSQKQLSRKEKSRKLHLRLRQRGKVVAFDFAHPRHFWLFFYATHLAIAPFAG